MTMTMKWTRELDGDMRLVWRHGKYEIRRWNRVSHQGYAPIWQYRLSFADAPIGTFGRLRSAKAQAEQLRSAVASEAPDDQCVTSGAPTRVPTRGGEADRAWESS